MTTFQDPPPHSRRAARQSERGEGSAPTPVEAVPYAFDAAEPAASEPASAEPASAEQSAPEHSATSQTEQQERAA